MSLARTPLSKKLLVQVSRLELNIHSSPDERDRQISCYAKKFLQIFHKHLSFLLLKYFTMGRYRILDQQGLNFLTFTVVGWIDIFSRKTYRDIILNSLTFCRNEKGLLVFAYVIMSNHLHLVLQAGPQATFTLSEIIRDFKKYTANRIITAIQDEPESRREWLMHMFSYYAKFNGNNRHYQFWQQDNHPFLLYTEPMIWQKINYIHQNPVKAGIVDIPEAYLYSSARNYANDNKDCLMQIDLLEAWWTEVGKI